MEKKPPQPNTGPEAMDVDMEAFRQEIASLIAERQKGGGVAALQRIVRMLPQGLSQAEKKKITREQYGAPIDMMELLDIKPEQLSDLIKEDALMYYRIKNYTPGLITKEEMMQYRQRTILLRNFARLAFVSALANKLQVLITEEMEQKSKEQKGFK